MHSAKCHAAPWVKAGWQTHSAPKRRPLPQLTEARDDPARTNSKPCTTVHSTSSSQKDACPNWSSTASSTGPVPFPTGLACMSAWSVLSKIVLLWGKKKLYIEFSPRLLGNPEMVPLRMQGNSYVALNWTLKVSYAEDDFRHLRASAKTSTHPAIHSTPSTSIGSGG